MRTPRNFEAIFLVTAALATLTAYATAGVPDYQPAKRATAAVVADSANVQVVTIVGKRLSAEEKAALD